MPKKNFQKFLILFFISLSHLIFFRQNTFCQSLNTPSLSIISSSENEVIFDFILPNFEFQDSDLDGFSKIIIKADAFTQKEGFPSLPFWGEILSVPQDGSISISVADIVSKEYTLSKQIEPAFNVVPISDWLNTGNTDILPTSILGSFQEEHTPSHVSFTQIPDNAYYRQGGLYPEEIITTSDTAFAGFQKIQSFNFYPFRTNPTTNSLIVIEKARIVVRISSLGTQPSWLHQNTDAGKMPAFPVNTTPYTPRYSDPFLVSEIQLRIIDEGLYKVTYDELKSQMQSMIKEYNIAFSWHIDQINPNHLELSNRGHPVPIYFEGEADQSFDKGDYFEFWAEHVRGETSYFHPYTTRNIYTLRLVTHLGSRMALQNGGLTEIDPLLINIPDAFDQTVHFERQLTSNRLANQISQNNLDFQKEDVLFWKSINAPAMDRTPFQLEYPINSVTQQFQATVSIWGITHTNINDLDHHARVWVNTALIADHRWSNQNERVFQNTTGLGNFHLAHGTNDLFIDLSGDTAMGDREQVALDYFRITYWREYKTDTDFLKFNKPSDAPLGIYQFELHNFTEEEVFVYKIGFSKIVNLSIQPLSEQNLPPYIVKFQNLINTEGIEFVALTESMKKQVHSFLPDIPSELKNPHQQADYLIVTNTEFTKAEGTLLFQQIWQSRGVNVQIIDVQDIYDEFNHGIVSPVAIRDFFRYAYINWSLPRFSHVLLLGSGIYDKRYQSEIDRFDIVPIHKIWTYRNGATPSDNWYACIIGDDPLPDFHISRISVYEADQILPIAQKSQQYLENKNFQDFWHSNVTLVAGGRDDDNTDIFAQQNERIRENYIPQNYQANRVYTRVDVGSPQYLGNTTTLLNRINEGTSYLQFLGHGGGRIWADSNLLNTDNVRSLTNRNFPFVSSLSCFAAAFETRGMNSISEVFIAEPNKGAIAHFGFAGLGYITQIEDSGNYMAEAFFNKDINTFGEMATYHKIRYYARYNNHHSWLAHVHGAILMGDPMLSNFRPEISGEISLNSHLLSPGETLHIIAQFDTDITNAKTLILNELEIPINTGNAGILPANSTGNTGIFSTPGRYEYSFTLPENIEEGEKTIKIIASGFQREVVAMSSFAVGNSIYVDNMVLPNMPTENDSIQFRVRVYKTEPIDNLWVNVWNQEYDATFPMFYDPSTDFWQSEKTDTFPAGAIVYYGFSSHLIAPPMKNEWGGERGDIPNSELRTPNSYPLSPTSYPLNFSFRIYAPDLALLSLSLVERDNTPGLEAYIQNIGDITSPETSLVIKQGATIFNSVSLKSLEPLETIYQFIALPENLQNITITASVNDFLDFGEYLYTNNTLNFHLNNMFFKAGIFETNVRSNDQNLEISIPPNFLPQEAWFSLQIDDYKTPHLQPDVQPVSLLNGQFSPIYQIDLLNKSLLADSTGVFADNKKMTLSFHISSPLNSHNSRLTTPNPYPLSPIPYPLNSHIFRFDDFSKKWIYQGGYYNETNNTISTEINRTGIYTLLRNLDHTPPHIEINVSGQQFAVGGYISGNSVLSFIFSDENGIDITEKTISMTLNSEQIDPAKYSMTINPENTNNIPLNYHLSLQRGEYTIDAAVHDVNGNKTERQFHFRVSDRFDLTRVANYPNPVRSVTIDPVNSGRTRFTYTLTDDADNVSIRVYTVSGRLVKSFRNLPNHVGYHEYPRTTFGWDCRDEEGFFLANGVYFYRITARKGNQEITKTGKLAVLK